MANTFEQLRFRFQEDLALKNSLYSIAEFVLDYALEVSGADSCVFLYAAPGSPVFEKVATRGLTSSEDAAWSKCDRGSELPLPKSIRTQKLIEVANGELVKLIAYPLNDSDITIAGFSLSFEEEQILDHEARNVLLWLAQLTENALFNKDGEGV